MANQDHSTPPATAHEAGALRADAEQSALEQQALQHTTKLLQAVMDGATDAIFLKDTTGRFLLFNKAAGSFIGRKPKDVIGLTVNDTFGDSIAREIRERELAVLTTGQPSTVEETIITDGQVRTFLTTRSPHRDEQGNIIGLIGIARNITDMKRAEQELKQSYEALRKAAQELGKAKDEAESAERVKSGFLATMSHEIRTPMNAVIGMTRLALNTELSVRQRNYLEKVDASACTLLNIINDVLDFSKIEAGGLTLETTEFQLDSVLTSVSDVTSVKAEEKGLEMIFAVAPGVPQTLRGDPLRLGQILINLVGNAVKFTHSGEINVAVKVDTQLDSRCTLKFSVQDTGIGLDPCQIDDLFRAFSQLRPDISRRYGGTGLGLAICRQLVELMGGRIWAGGELGHGSAFHFTVELGLVPHTLAQAEQAFVGQRVLIAEDNANARESLMDMVRAFGMQPLPVDSGLATLSALKSAARECQPFDLLLLDWKLPDMEGMEVARRMLADPQLRQVPTLLVATTYGRDGVLRSAESLGLAGVLIKPVTRSMLRSALRQTLPGDPARAAAPVRANRGLQIPPDAERQLSGRPVLVVDDNALNREVVGDMLSTVGMQVDSAVTGLDALRKLANRQYDFVLMDVHMPEMDGINAAREIRSQRRFDAMPLIAITAQTLAESRETTLAAGMNAHLTKPIDEAVLYSTLMALARGAEPVLAAAGPAPVPQVAQPAPTPPPTDAAPRVFSLDKLGSDPVRLKALLRDFLNETTQTGSRVAQLIGIGDLKEAAALAHSVRGSAFYLDARDVYESASRLEAALRQSGTAEPHVREFRTALTALHGQIREYLG